VGDNDENVTNLLAQAYNKFARYGNLSSFTCMEDVLAMASSQREILGKEP